MPGDAIGLLVDRDGQKTACTVVLGDIDEPENAMSVCEFGPYCGCAAF